MVTHHRGQELVRCKLDLVGVQGTGFFVHHKIVSAGKRVIGCHTQCFEVAGVISLFSMYMHWGEK
jgi:hypothetical protein